MISSLGLPQGHCSCQMYMAENRDFLTHCIQVDSSTVTCWMSPFVILEVLGLFCYFYSIFDGKSY